MKRKLILATVAALSLAAVPAMAQPSARGYVKQRPVPQRPVRPAVMMPSVSSYAPHAAAAGKTVTIRGRNFQAGTIVKLDGKLIAPSSLTASRITFTLPRNASDGTLALVGPRGLHMSVGAFNVVAPVRVIGRGYSDDGWIKTRTSRRNKNRDAILGRWNRRFLASPAAKAELALHAQRLAKLNRISRLAKAYGDALLVSRVKRAIGRENTRHERKMKQLETRYIATYKPIPRPRRY